MSVLLAALVGIYDVHAQFLIGMATGICNLTGLAIELLPRDLIVPRGSREGSRYAEKNPIEDPSGLRSTIRTVGLLLFWLATILIVSAFLVIICYFSQGSPPDFVYVAFYGTIVAYATFAINMYLERFFGIYDFVKAEKIYIILSFTAKTFLAWDVYGGFKAAE
mmetsp:Transcript_23572/g.32910  ORF Transcript_23572/g.32910 Transcript_23572/m.32910 type:complete len:164 (-) Transcript_23572:401-892(-)